MHQFLTAFLWPIPIQTEHLALLWIGMALMVLSVLERYRIF
ncbi:hypothetical protein [Gloeobacter violaceus]|nr:hypothetical protein [Gloeobacter violaceus]